MSETATDGYWLETCQQCGTVRLQPTRQPEASPHRQYTNPQAHAPSQQSHIAIKPATVERTW